MAEGASALVAALHGRILRAATSSKRIHFQGLQQVARHIQVRRGTDANPKRTAVVRKLRQLDGAFALLRHITDVSSDKFFGEVMELLHEEDPDGTICAQYASNWALLSMPHAQQHTQVPVVPGTPDEGPSVEAVAADLLRAGDPPPRRRLALTWRAANGGGTSRVDPGGFLQYHKRHPR